jgi:hypothetical protein
MCPAFVSTREPCFANPSRSLAHVLEPLVLHAHETDAMASCGSDKLHCTGTGEYLFRHLSPCHLVTLSPCTCNQKQRNEHNSKSQDRDAIKQLQASLRTAASPASYMSPVYTGVAIVNSLRSDYSDTITSSQPSRALHVSSLHAGHVFSFSCPLLRIQLRHLPCTLGVTPTPASPLVGICALLVRYAVRMCTTAPRECLS